MSRSYKRTPRCGNKKDGFLKRQANKIVRKIDYDRTPQHKAYKKAYCSWNICDYEEVGTTYQAYLKCSRLHNELEDCEETRQYYLKCYIRK